jgi:crossover junction endodeoxyribonuclease RusA
MIWFDLPFPPSANALWRSVRGRMILSAKYRAWSEAAASQASMYRKAASVTGPYTLRIQAGRPDKRKRDIDNLIKPVSDALVNAGIVEGDHLCQEVTACWLPGVAGVRVLVLPTKERT